MTEGFGCYDRAVNDRLTDRAAEIGVAQRPFACVSDHLNGMFKRGLLASATQDGRQQPVPSITAVPQRKRPPPDRSRTMAVDPSLPILVVDDYGTMIRIIRNLLRQLGFLDVDDAPDGSIALSKMQLKRYGLVISDWNMEPMTGYELLRQVRADPSIAATPFIMVTAESKTENVIAAKQAGVNNYIVKPFNADTLKTKIEAVFAA
jgi:two-component system chemotaxis response regulator CheY